MRVLGLIGLLLALAIVALTVKKQLGATAAIAPPNQASVTGVAPHGAGQPAQQVQQFKQSLDAAMQQRPEMPDDAK